MEEIHSMKEPVGRERNLQRKKREPLPVIDISYVELPDRLTYRIDASYILGAAAVLAMIAATGTAEDNLLLSLVCTAVFAGCTYLSIKEDGRRK